MAKTIKFNLICDNYPIRTLEDLREHFCIEDVLKYYKNDLLQRWLNVRGYSKEHDEASSLSCADDLSIINELIRILGVEADRDTIIKSTYILKFQQEDIDRCKKYNAQRYQTNLIISDYNMGYRQLVRQILENKDDWAIIKAAVEEINDKYQSIFDTDYRTLFYSFLNYAPMALFAMMCHEKMREKYLFTSDVELGKQKAEISKSEITPPCTCETVTDFLRNDIMEKALEGREAKASEEAPQKNSVAMNKIMAKIEMDHKAMNTELCALTTEDRLREIFGKNLREFSPPKNQEWYEVACDETGGKKHPKCMILNVKSGHVRPMDVCGKFYTAKDVNNKFVIFDGVQFYGAASYEGLVQFVEV